MSSPWVSIVTPPKETELLFFLWKIVGKDFYRSKLPSLSSLAVAQINVLHNQLKSASVPSLLGLFSLLSGLFELRHRLRCHYLTLSLKLWAMEPFVFCICEIVLELFWWFAKLWINIVLSWPLLTIIGKLNVNRVLLTINIINGR